MPELPEVETVKRGLAPVMEGRKFVSVKLNRADIRLPFPADFVERLEGKTLLRLTRRAKFLVAELSSGETLLMHLGMSGRFVIGQGCWPMDSGTHNPKHDHVVFTMSAADDAPASEAPLIIYNDPRRFGFMELLGVGDTGRIADLGPEPLSNQFNGPALHEKLGGKKAPIKSALLDQRVVAGLGNIYVCEALFGAHISPLRHANRLSLAQCELLCAEIKTTLRAAIQAGGSTLNDFVAADGALGYFQHRFKVYGHEGTNCPAKTDSLHPCDGTITRTTQSGRSSFYCPQCQNKVSERKRQK